MAGHFRAKVASPWILNDRSATLITLKKWFNVLKVYCQQNEEFDPFFPGEAGENENWTAHKVDATRGITITARQAVQAVEADADNGIEAVEAVEALTAAEAQTLSRQRRKDLDALLSIYANHVPECYYEMVLEDATSIQWIYTKLSQSLGLQATKQYFLNSHTIQYDSENDTPEKLYMRLRGHYQLAAPKAGSTFDGVVLEQHVKIGPLAELMLVEKTLERIDSRLPAHIVKTRGHLMEDGHKTLFCIRRLLWDSVADMLIELDKAGDAEANYVDSRTKWPGKSKNRSDKSKHSSSRSRDQRSNKTVRFDKSKNGGDDKICGICFRAGKSQEVYSSHHQTQCRNLSRSEKSRILRAAARMIDSSTITDQDASENQTGSEADTEEDGKSDSS